MPITARAYEDGDYHHLLAFIREIYRLHGPPVYATAGELDWWRCIDPTLEGIGRARVWLDGESIVGFAYPAYGRVDLFVHPRYDELHDPLLAWAEGARLREMGGPTTLRTWSFTGDAPRLAALHARGYSRGEAFFYARSRPVNAPLPPALAPEGYTVRSVDPARDLPARVEVHKSAFMPSSLTVARYRRAVQSACYRADLDLVAVAPDGAFASFCIVWHDAANRIGAFEPVGTHPAHRRRGLARAVMVEGLRRLAALGAETAFVNTYYEDEPAIRLYESLDFPEIDRFYEWSKPVGT
jgi:mycothiol synthase